MAKRDLGLGDLLMTATVDSKGMLIFDALSLDTSAPIRKEYGSFSEIYKKLEKVAPDMLEGGKSYKLVFDYDRDVTPAIERVWFNSVRFNMTSRAGNNIEQKLVIEPRVGNILRLGGSFRAKGGRRVADPQIRVFVDVEQKTARVYSYDTGCGDYRELVFLGEDSVDERDEAVLDCNNALSMYLDDILGLLKVKPKLFKKVPINR